MVKEAVKGEEVILCGMIYPRCHIQTQFPHPREKKPQQESPQSRNDGKIGKRDFFISTVN
jgi:hypothetical protein